MIILQTHLFFINVQHSNPLKREETGRERERERERETQKDRNILDRVLFRITVMIMKLYIVQCSGIEQKIRLHCTMHIAHNIIQ